MLLQGSDLIAFKQESHAAFTGHVLNV